jgi:hypothetical protein
VHHHLGVGLGPESVAGLDQVGTQLAIVRDDPVVNEGETSGAVEVRVSVGLGHPSVRCPARVPEADGAGRKRRHRLADLPDPPFQESAAVAGYGHAPGVVAVVLKLLKGAEHDGRRVLVTADVAEDPTHGALPLRRRTHGSIADEQRESN